MALLKTKPKINLMMQREILPGGAYGAQVVMQASRDVPVDWINVRIDGEERATVGAGEHQRVLRRRLLSLGAELSGKRTLPRGRTELAFRFEVPPGLPPTYRGRSCATEYVATVHASIPWWPDAKGSFEMFLSQPGPAGSVKPEPVLFSSDPGGPAASEPHVEGSLASSVIVPGGTVEGALALNNVAANPYSGVELDLVGTEHIRDARAGALAVGRVDALRYGLEIALSSPVEGASIPFRFRVPAELAPSHDAGLWTLSWALEVRVKLRWRADLLLRVPVVVVPAAAGRGGAAGSRLDFRAPPSVGSERVEKVWRSVAAELGLVPETGALRGRQGQVDYEVRREHRGRLGVFLVARLTYPSLELDLRVEPRRTLLDRWARQALPALEPGVWDPRHGLRARDPGQAAAVGRRLGPALRQFTGARLDDDEALVERQGSGQRRQKLVEFVVAVRGLAAAIEEARASIPPPLAMAGGLEPWRAFAAQLGGVLETARMIVQGHFHAMPVELRTEWTPDGRPERTVLALVPNATIAAENEIHLASGNGAPLAPDLIAGASIPGSARALVEAIAGGGALAFDLTGQELRLALPAPILDPAPLAGRLVQMTQLCELVRSAKGPFR